MSFFFQAKERKRDNERCIEFRRVLYRSVSTSKERKKKKKKKKKKPHAHMAAQRHKKHIHTAQPNSSNTIPPLAQLHIFTVPAFLINWHIDTIKGRDPAVVMESHIATRCVFVGPPAAHPVARAIRQCLAVGFMVPTTQ